MPEDTLVVTHTSDSLPLRDSLAQVRTTVFTGQTQLDNSTWFFIVMAAFVGIIAAAFFINWLLKRHLQKQAYRAARRSFSLYDEWLTAYNGYYKSLPPDLRKRFLERVSWFMSTKTFTCIGLPLEEKMPLLISAASIQISFGLDKYLLDFFDTIYVMQHNYNYGMYSQPFEGHVNSNGIYLSWDNFLRGYEDYADGDNVGIHEMAHALAYVNFMAGNNDAQDDGFIHRFYDFSAVARPIFNEMQKGNINVLGGYAATNYNEFWAVAVEVFFEKPLNMKLDIPALYDSMCRLLNQDPLSPGKLLAITGSLVA
jgi:Mlc titration factor MtfA (ptsG expression regulator)